MPILTGTDVEIRFARASLGPNGEQGTGASYGPTFLPGGSGIAFYTFAPDLAPGDVNGTLDAVVKTLATGAVAPIAPADPNATGTIVSATPNEFILLGLFPRFSADGSKAVVVADDAARLATGDTNGHVDVFVRDSATGTTTLISHGLNGAQSNGISYFGDISGDGSKVVFQSAASNLVAGDGNRAADIFVADVTTGAISLVSSNAAGVQANRGSALPRISDDGTHAVFQTLAALVAEDTNDRQDVYVKDLLTGAVTLVSADALGAAGNGDSTHGEFSPDGGKILFHTTSSNFTAGDLNAANDIFLKDLATGAITLVSQGASGEHGDAASTHGVFSPDGNLIAFQSFATNFIPGDVNNTSDVFVKNLTTGELNPVSVNESGQTVRGSSNHPAFAPDGQSVAFTSSSSTLVGGDTNQASDVLIAQLGPLSDGADVLTGGTGADELYGLSGNDLLNGGLGNDLINGGAGTDTASYAYSANAVRVSLAFTTAQNTLGAGMDTLIDIENLIGSVVGDTLIGNGFANALTGAGGADKLNGANGADTLIGGEGADQLTGGAGGDRFVFTALMDSSVAASGRDRILDFSTVDGDLIDLGAIDAIAGGADNAFTLVGAFTRHAGELMQTATASGRLFQGDVDGDGRGDFSIYVAGVTPLSATDFIL